MIIDEVNPSIGDLHLSMKEGSLFCFVVMRSTKLGCFRSCSWCLWKALDEEGYMGLVQGCRLLEIPLTPLHLKYFS